MSDVRLSNASPTLERVDARQPEDTLRPPVRRNLFGRPDPGEIRRNVAAAVRDDVQAFRERYNFDPVEHRPLAPRNYEWQEDSSPPEFYLRAAHGSRRPDAAERSERRSDAQPAPGRPEKRRSGASAANVLYLTSGDADPFTATMKELFSSQILVMFEVFEGGNYDDSQHFIQTHGSCRFRLLPFDVGELPSFAATTAARARRSAVALLAEDMIFISDSCLTQDIPPGPLTLVTKTVTAEEQVHVCEARYRIQLDYSLRMMKNFPSPMCLRAAHCDTKVSEGKIDAGGATSDRSMELRQAH
ncbi:hypothetical protein F2P81_018678 [Scophthalmus maximus]|uniref:Cyclin-dependent kinase inhibitor 1B n=1 Tax=Scophthalmus maximus TaxID=52904 RepID=A0A6A4S5B6_SCOMX|nr:hypothetical protein F2P81_018678 [Scophthalmus maximus]